MKVANRATLSAGALAEADVRSDDRHAPRRRAAESLSRQWPGGLLRGADRLSKARAAKTHFSPGAPEPLRFSTEKAACPTQSKLGTRANQDAAALEKN